MPHHRCRQAAISRISNMEPQIKEKTPCPTKFLVISPNSGTLCPVQPQAALGHAADMSLRHRHPIKGVTSCQKKSPAPSHNYGTCSTGA